MRKLLASTALTFTLMLGAPALGSAATEEIKLEVNEPEVMKNNLTRFVGKNVMLKLNSGEEIGGTVKAVGANAVHLSSLTGREFFDAVVPLERITALIVRAKGYPEPQEVAGLRRTPLSVVCGADHNAT